MGAGELWFAPRRSKSMADPEIPEVRAQLLRDDVQQRIREEARERAQQFRGDRRDSVAAEPAAPSVAEQAPPLQASDAAPAVVPQVRTGFVWLGALLAGLGLLAIVFPFVSTLATVVFVGGVFLAAGVLKLFAAFRCPTFWSVAAKAAWALAYIIGGGLILYTPVTGAWSITIILSALFIIGGVLSLTWALTPPHRHGRGWLMASGLLSILLGALVGMTAPFSALWFPGVVAGVDLLSTGLAFLFMDRAMRASLAQAEVAS